MMCSPPASTTFSWSTSMIERASASAASIVAWSTSAGLRSRLCRSSEARPAGSPPSLMSVPRPAMFVAIVTAPLRPAWATTPASFSWNLAFSVSCPIPRRLRSVESTSLFSTETVPTRTGPPGLRHLLDLVDQRVELARLVLEHEVGVVVADHRPVGRDRDDLEVVDLVELLGLGHRRAGHAGELVVQPEVVLERDRGERPGLALDPQPLLRLDRLVEALAPAPAGHLAPGELVDDDDLAVLDDVVAVAPVQRVRLERGVEVAGEPRVGVVQVVDAEQALDLVDALLGRADGLVLEVEEVVAALLGALGPLLEPGHEAGEGEVQVRRLLGLARDDQRGPRLVDEDVVDLVDDREEPLPLHPRLERVDHVVAQVVEAELVVGPVRDVGLVGLAPGHRAAG